MRAFVALGPVNLYAVWSLVVIALVTVGLTYVSEWRKSARLSRGLVVAMVVGTVFVFVGFNCDVFGGWVPDWFCYLI